MPSVCPHTVLDTLYTQICTWCIPLHAALLKSVGVTFSDPNHVSLVNTTWDGNENSPTTLPRRIKWGSGGYFDFVRVRKCVRVCALCRIIIYTIAVLRILRCYAMFIMFVINDILRKTWKFCQKWAPTFVIKSFVKV